MPTFDNYLKINNSLSYIGYNYNAPTPLNTLFPELIL